MEPVILMCGAAGSGKSTHARELQARGFVLLSFDEEAWHRGYRTHPLPEGARREVHDALQRRLLTLVDARSPVVVDTSFWSRASRDEYRRLLSSRGVEPVVHYMDTPREVALERLAARSSTGPDDVPVPVATANAYFDGLEVPTEAEGPLCVVTTRADRDGAL